MEVRNGQAWSTPPIVQSSGDPLRGTDNKGKVIWLPLESDTKSKVIWRSLQSNSVSPLRGATPAVPNTRPSTSHSPKTAPEDVSPSLPGPHDEANGRSKLSTVHRLGLHTCILHMRQQLYYPGWEEAVERTAIHYCGPSEESPSAPHQTNRGLNHQPSPQRTQPRNSIATPWDPLLSPTSSPSPGLLYGTPSGNKDSGSGAIPLAAPRTTSSASTSVRGASCVIANAPENHLICDLLCCQCPKSVLILYSYCVQTKYG